MRKERYAEVDLLHRAFLFFFSFFPSLVAVHGSRGSCVSIPVDVKQLNSTILQGS